MHPPHDCQFILLLTKYHNSTKRYLLWRLRSHPTTQLNSTVVIGNARHEDFMMEMWPTNFHCGVSLGCPRSSNAPKCFTSLQPRTTPLSWSPYTFCFNDHLFGYLCNKSCNISCIHPTCPSVWFSNELCIWSLQGAHNRSETDFHHESTNWLCEKSCNSLAFNYLSQVLNSPKNSAHGLSKVCTIGLELTFVTNQPN